MNPKSLKEMNRTMNRREFKHAVRKATRVLAFVRMTDEFKMMSGIKISKAQALRLVANRQFDTASIAAEWADDTQTILFVGTR